MLKVVFRVDASIHIGSGHVMRCLSLAEMFSRYDSEVVFAARAQDGDLCSYIETRGYSVLKLVEPEVWKSPKYSSDYAAWLQVSQEEDADSFVSLVENADIVVVDHYGLDVAWESLVKKFLQCTVIAIDDLMREHNADIIIDQTLNRAVDEYRATNRDTLILAGTTFAMLRDNFSEFHEEALRKRLRHHNHKILVFMGGIDKTNATFDVLSALSERENKISTTVLLGKNAPHFDSVASFCKRHGSWLTHVAFTDDMASLMLEHTMAIGAPGSTSWERACLGLPSVIVPLADNQREISSALNSCGLAVSLMQSQISERLEHSLNTLISNFDSMRRNNLDVCDGLGCQRVVSISRQLSKNSRALYLRNASKADIKLVHTWQTMPEIRKYSNNTEIPSWLEHKAWMEDKLNQVDNYFYIIECYDSDTGLFQSVGVVRLDLVNEGDDYYTISIYLDPSVHGGGLGLDALMLLNDMHPYKSIYAKVLEENHASQRIFTKAGYLKTDKEGFVRRPLEQKHV